LRPKFQSKQEVIINASLRTVWNFNQDLSEIPEYHPCVYKVDFSFNKHFREAGVSSQCHLKDGKNEIIPMQNVVTVFPQDTIGLASVCEPWAHVCHPCALYLSLIPSQYSAVRHTAAINPFTSKIFLLEFTTSCHDRLRSLIQKCHKSLGNSFKDFPIE
jgi:hypothetical protein